ncbi:serine/threonine-protein kinase [Streptomyces diastatochromogenes]|uniref:Serine/threonine protein kinase n=1 Tax=Streptomyces diastatochromogenes TaxID=42236 RepID=A0A233S171_STRDA|nr:serine/threonine-protein kinase [Streptomyces diastatochromogenes]OXY89397.1 serine/threonine protein kinase [Streptomyces diastatochromogenes]
MSTTGAGGRVQPAHPGDPARIGPYRIIGRLGSGGMGTVHAGLTVDGLRVAVKVIHPAQAQDPEFRARFRREVHLSARVQGPCLVPLLAADPEADAPWLATAYAPGPTLNRHLAEHGPLTGGTLYAFATGTAQALAAIHAAGVVHRDVKPQNVILTPAGPRALDFGIAHAADGTSVTRTGVLTGTPGWISPEYYRDGTAGPEGDLFAWGALVAYAATGRLPFGGGAPDAVAFRVMSGEPDLDGVPRELREIVTTALAKEPADRRPAVAAAEQCARLLAAQTTQVVGGEVHLGPARAGDPVMAQWDLPTLDDPRWHAPATPSSRKRTITTVLVAAAVAGGLAGAAIAFPRGGSDHAGRSDQSTATASPAAHEDSTARHTGSAAPDGTTRAPEPAADPRRATVPTDPLAGVPDPAFTRAGDETQPGDDEWRASTVAGSAAEQDVARAVRDDVTAMLATKDMAFMEPTVTFNKRAQTLMVTGGPISQLPDEQQEVFRRSGEMAACTALARRLGDDPTAWPYGRYSVFWKDSDTDPEPNILGFGEATDGCYHQTAGQWQGDESGMATAQIPSSDRAEIRVADATDKAITAAWKVRVAEGNGVDPAAADNDISLGFDPVEKAAYVWMNDPDGTLIGRAQRDNFQDVVTTTACRRLVSEYSRNKAWKYTRWSIAVFEGNARFPELTGSGDCMR